MESLDSDMVRENTPFITGEVRSYLAESAKWGKFLAIMGYIGIGLMLLLAVGVMAMGSASQLVPGMGMNMGAFGLVYVVIAAFYFFPVYYLHQFSLKIKHGLTSQDPQSITTGFQNLKSLFKFMGIFTIAILSIYALVIVIAIVAGVSGAM
jgi:hypothetical protein